MEKTLVNNEKMWTLKNKSKTVVYRNHDLPAVVCINHPSFGWYGFERPFNLASEIYQEGDKYWFAQDAHKKNINDSITKILSKNGILSITKIE